MLAYLDAFHRHGYVVFRNTPVDEGTVRLICDRLGYISGNNFGWVFDVRADPKPTDLAYTSVGLLAHTDQPYRQPTPGIQLLHCLRNEAPGGDSTLADGLAGAEALRLADPEARRALVETEMEFRYDMITDTVVSHGCTSLRVRPARPVPADPTEHQARRSDPAGRTATSTCCTADGDGSLGVAERPGAPGDVPPRTGRRDVHGQHSACCTAVPSSTVRRGARHLQGAYIDHDGPDTMYRLRRPASPIRPGRLVSPLVPPRARSSGSSDRRDRCAILAARIRAVGRAGGVS